MKDKKASKSECVKVAIRVRPMNKHEKEQNSRLCVTVDTANNTVSVISDFLQQIQFFKVIMVQYLLMGRLDVEKHLL